MKYEIPIRRVVDKEPEPQPIPPQPFTFEVNMGQGQYTTMHGQQVNVQPPMMSMEVKIQFSANQHSGADLFSITMMATRELEEYVKRDLNSMVNRVHTNGGFGMGMGVNNPSTVEMDIQLDPNITNTSGLHSQLRDFLHQRNCTLHDMHVTANNPAHDPFDAWMDQDHPGSIPVQPAQTIEYEPTTIACSDCHEDFLHTELMKDNAIWGEGDLEKSVSSDKVCPKCGAWDCCELEFARLGG